MYRQRICRLVVHTVLLCFNGLVHQEEERQRVREHPQDDAVPRQRRVVSGEADQKRWRHHSRRHPEAGHRQRGGGGVAGEQVDQHQGGAGEECGGGDGSGERGEERRDL